MKYCEVVNSSFSELVSEIKGHFNTSGKTLFESRNVIKVVEYKGSEYVVKSFKIPHLLNQFVYRFFRKSKARRSFENSVLLEKKNISVPKAIGYVEFRRGCLLKESFYLSSFLKHDFEIRAVLLDANFPNREEILKAFISFTYALHNKDVFHVDYSPGNILVKEEKGGYEFSLVDVNRMKFMKLDSELRMKNLAKLTFNEADNEFFVYEYAKHNGENTNTLRALLQKYNDKHADYLAKKKKLKEFKKNASS